MVENFASASFSIENRGIWYSAPEQKVDWDKKKISLYFVKTLNLTLSFSDMQTSLLSFFTRTPKGSPQQPKGSPKTPLGSKVSNGKGDQNSPLSSKSANAKVGANPKYPPGKEIEGFYKLTPPPTSS